MCDEALMKDRLLTRFFAVKVEDVYVYLAHTYTHTHTHTHTERERESERERARERERSRKKGRSVSTLMVWRDRLLLQLRYQLNKIMYIV